MCRQRAKKERRPLRGKGGEPFAHHSGSEVWASALFWRRALALARWRRWIAIFGGALPAYSNIMLPMTPLGCISSHILRIRANSTRRGVRPGAKRPRPDLRDRALERDLPRIGHDSGARLSYGGGKIGHRQHAIEGRLGEAIDDRMPVGETLTIGVAITLHHGRGLHDGDCCLRLLGQAAADHVQPAFDPGALLGIAHREQTPSPP